MSEERYLARSAVFILIRNKKGEVLLMRRSNTGYMDGYYDFPSGHVERGERVQDAAARELLEETGVKVRIEDLKLWHINQFSAGGQDYYNFFFVADVWQGEPTITEADKCDDMQFFSLSALPKMTAGTHVALEHHDGQDSEVSFGFIDQPTYDRIVAL
jgi:8-oxo-dGTP diphosphatase